MGCDISSEQLWSWVDRDAPELEAHIDCCPTCRRRTDSIRRKMRVIAAGSSVVIPDRIGPYIIKNLLGEGGQALVYEAEQPDPRRKVALKVLKGGRFAGERLVRHFRRECEALARLRHPGIATIFEAGHTDEGLHYFALERVEGVPLGAYIRESDPSPDRRMDLFVEICEAVAYAHERGVIHLDLKPSNIIIDENGSPRILDFGIARMTRGDAPSGSTFTGTRTGLIAGTPRYMSPEQARGESRHLDARSDVYSLGVILYELLAGRAPGENTDLTPERLLQFYEQAPQPPSRIDRTIHSELDTIVLKAMDREPERRYGSVTEFAEDIRRFRNSEPILARPPGVMYRLRKGIYRNRGRIGIATLAAAALTAAFIGFQPDRTTPLDPRKARILLLEIRTDLLRGEWDGIVSRADAAAQKCGNLPEAVLLQAQAAYRARDPMVAHTFLESRIKRNPERWSYPLLLAEIKGFRDDTELPMHPGTSSGPSDSAEDWYLKSFATLDLRRSLEWAGEAVRRDPRHVPSLATLALVSPIDDDVDGAVVWASRLIEQEPDLEYWRNYLVELLFEHARYEESLAEADRMAALFPGRREIHHMRGRILRRLKRYEEAVREYTYAINTQTDQRPSPAWLYYHRGTMLWILGREEEAVSDYIRANRSIHHATYTNVRQYFIQHQLGRPEDAEATLREALGRNTVNRWLGTILSCLAGELSPSDLVAAASTQVQQCEAFYYAGEVSLLQGRTETAISWFRACIDTGLESDPSEFWEPMSEYELAGWRLETLPGLRDGL